MPIDNANIGAPLSCAKLIGQLVEVIDLSAEQRDAMFDLMDRHYVNVQRPIFDADLDEKQWIIQVCDAASGRLCGFSTQRLLEVDVAGRSVKALFSGDTIIDRQHWGNQALTHVWGRLALALIDGHPGAELYWFLISQGYKTYRFLPVFFHEFYPRHDVPTPPWARSVIDALAGAALSRSLRCRPGRHRHDSRTVSPA